MYTCAYLGEHRICQATGQQCIGTVCDCWGDENCGSEMIKDEEKEEDSSK